MRAEVVKIVKKSRQERAGERGRKKKTTPGSNEGKDEEERRERNMPGAKDLRRTSGVRRGTSTRRRWEDP
jgi:hypothetical protein